MLRINSLSFRLIASAAVWSILALAVGGFILANIFRGTVESDFDDRLTFELEGLVAAAQIQPDSPQDVSLENRFADPRFERIYSGWYWQIEPVSSGNLPPQTSRSLWDKVLKVHDLVTHDGMQWGYATGPDMQSLRVLVRPIALPTQYKDGEQSSQSFRFLVAGDLSDTDQDIARFDKILFWYFVALGGGLIAAVVLQVRIGLQPLRRVSEALARIREGRARQLEGTFPAEIAPLATELNGLIAHSAEVVARARTHVANLAHYLKTPLTVLANEAADGEGPLADTVSRQVTAMRRQVDHYLARARAVGALDVLGNRTEVTPVLRDLVRVLERMHAERNIAIELNAPDGLAFRGEREDLEEMSGNLIDNACKWARGRVIVSAKTTGPNRFCITVSDDGPGLPEEARERALQRGERLDESVPGSGLGLSIVRDIAKLYGGDIALGQAALGGLEAQLELPLMRQAYPAATTAFKASP